MTWIEALRGSIAVSGGVACLFITILTGIACGPHTHWYTFMKEPIQALPRAGAGLRSYRAGRSGNTLRALALQQGAPNNCSQL